MSLVTSDDITVAWGTQPPQIEAQTGRWRTAIFQDVQESSDGKLLYFLYDPISDERAGGGGGRRRGDNCIVVFDLSLRCFIEEIPLTVPGRLKFLFALRPLCVGGETRAIVVSQIECGGGAIQLHLTLVNLTSKVHIPIIQPLDMAQDFICTIREDAPELIVMANPGLQVWRICAEVTGPTEPLEYFRVSGAQLNQFYDGFISGGTIFLLSSNTDTSLDYTRLHLLDMQTRSLTTTACSADPKRGVPVPRTHSGIVAMQGFIIVCGGERLETGRIQRLNDYWRLNLTSFQWERLSGQMPVPLIEPRITTTYSGHAYLWGDWDGNLPGIPHGMAHLRILRADGLVGYGNETPMVPPPTPPPGITQEVRRPSAPLLVSPSPDSPNYKPHPTRDIPDKERKEKEKKKKNEQDIGCCSSCTLL